MTPPGPHLCSLLKRGESLTHGPLRELGDTVQVQLVHDALAMALDRFHADMQHSGDLFRALAFSKELQDRALRALSLKSRDWFDAARRCFL